MVQLPMLQLVFSVCSIVEGASCHKLPPLPLNEGTTMVGCLMASQVGAPSGPPRIPTSTSGASHVSRPDASPRSEGAADRSARLPYALAWERSSSTSACRLSMSRPTVATATLRPAWK